MTTVTAAYAHAMAASVGLTITPEGEVMSGARVLHRLPIPADGQLHAQAYFDFLEWVRQSQPCRLGLVAAYSGTIRLEDMGVLGLAMKTAPTLRASFLRLERYHRLLTDTAVYRLDARREPAVLSIEACTDGHPVLTLRNECALASVIAKARQLSQGAPRFERVTFRHDCAGDPDAYARHFGCPVVFGAELDAVVVPGETLDLPNRLGDRAVSDFMTRHLDLELGRSEPARSLRSEVLQRLSGELSTGVPQAAAMARDMGMSERTFFRRLAGEGTSFRDLVREAQIRLARELLENSRCTIAEIAFLTGFSEQSTFGRAFKRAVGATPAQYRSEPGEAPRAIAPAGLAGPAQTLAGGADTLAAALG